MTSLAPEELWRAWHEVPSWVEKYWGRETWLSTTSNEEWTKGFFCPFVLTSLAPSLHARARFEVPLGNTKQDAILTDMSGVGLAHIEHEGGELESLYGEFAKLKRSSPSFKCGIGYGDEKQVEEHVHSLFEPAIERAIDESHGQQWMLIFGVYHNKELKNPEDWIAYASKTTGDKTILVRMNW